MSEIKRNGVGHLVLHAQPFAREGANDDEQQRPKQNIRSWYNRAVVEPVNDFCTREQYDRYMQQVPEFEHMLVEDGVVLVKFWFSISKEVQATRFASRRINPLKQWKLSALDARAKEQWDEYTKYKEVMFSRTH